MLGLGPVGRAAARRLEARGATVLVAEPDEERVEAARDVGLTFSDATLADGLARCDLVFDASPAADVIDAADLRPGDDRRRPRHAVGLHGGGAGAPRRAAHPRAARHRRRGDGGARAALKRAAPAVAACTIAGRGGSIGRISAGSKPT